MVHCGSAPTDSASCDWIQIEQQAVWYESNSEDPDQLAGDLVVGLFRDHEGSFWAHTKRGDVYRFEPRPPFRSYRHQAGNPRSLIDDFVIAAYEDTRGMLWVGTERGLNRIDRQSGLVTRYESPPFNRGVRSIAEDRTGSLWFGTRGDGLARVDPRTGATRTYRHAASAGSLSHDYVASLLVDRSRHAMGGHRRRDRPLRSRHEHVSNLPPRLETLADISLDCRRGRWRIVAREL